MTTPTPEMRNLTALRERRAQLVAAIKRLDVLIGRFVQPTDEARHAD